MFGDPSESDMVSKSPRHRLEHIAGGRGLTRASIVLNAVRATGMTGIEFTARESTKRSLYSPTNGQKGTQESRIQRAN